MNYDSKIEPLPDDEPVALDVLDVEDEASRKSRRKAWIVGIAAVVLLILVYFVLHSRQPDGFSAEAANQAPVVTVISPGRKEVAGRISATGTLAARREEPVGVSGEGGRVERVLVEPGDWVRAGQVLATIDRSVQAQQSQGLAAQIRVAEADARLAQSNLDRGLKLVERGFISKADIDRLTATRDSAAARVRVARAQLQESQARIRHLDIVAPSAGMVLERLVEPGQVVSAGSGVLFRLAKGGEMELLARLGEADLAKISTGITATVTPVGTDKSFTGQVWQVAPVIDPQNRQGTARIALGWSPGLRPGGFASAEIVAGTQVAPVLPESAVLADDKGSYVYIVGAGNKVERRPVKTGMVTDQGVVIESGISGTERVVKRAGAFLSVGETVKPVSENRAR